MLEPSDPPRLSAVTKRLHKNSSHENRQVVAVAARGSIPAGSNDGNYSLLKALSLLTTQYTVYIPGMGPQGIGGPGRLPRPPALRAGPVFLCSAVLHLHQLSLLPLASLVWFGRCIPTPHQSEI